MRHGTRARYNGSPGQPPCRCTACTEANRVYGEKRRRAAGMKPQRYGFTHGTRYGYRVKGCRCDECRENWNAYHRDNYRRRKAS